MNTLISRLREATINGDFKEILAIKKQRQANVDFTSYKEAINDILTTITPSEMPFSQLPMHGVYVTEMYHGFHMFINIIFDDFIQNQNHQYSATYPLAFPDFLLPYINYLEDKVFVNKTLLYGIFKGVLDYVKPIVDTTVNQSDVVDGDVVDYGEYDTDPDAYSRPLATPNNDAEIAALMEARRAKAAEFAALKEARRAKAAEREAQWQIELAEEEAKTEAEVAVETAKMNDRKKTLKKLRETREAQVAEADQVEVRWQIKLAKEMAMSDALIAAEAAKMNARKKTLKALRETRAAQMAEAENDGYQSATPSPITVNALPGWQPGMNVVVQEDALNICITDLNKCESAHLEAQADIAKLTYQLNELFRKYEEDIRELRDQLQKCVSKYPYDAITQAITEKYKELMIAINI